MDFTVLFLLALLVLTLFLVSLLWLSGAMFLSLKHDHKEYLEFDFDD